MRGIYRKQHLPNYGVFDELRYFQSGDTPAVVEVDGVTVGLTICEDIWQPGPPLSSEALAGAPVIVNLSASPYHAGKGLQRERMIGQRARDSLAAVAFCAQVGGQDELVFDGHSFVVDHEGRTVLRAPQFTAGLHVVTVDVEAARAQRLRDTRPRQVARTVRADVDHLGRFSTTGDAATPAAQGAIAHVLAPDAEVYEALVLGTRDYVEKNGFRAGRDRPVRRHRLDARRPRRRRRPRVRPRHVRHDAVAATPRAAPAVTRTSLAERLGVELLELPILSIMRAYDETLTEPFAGREPDLTEENLQARIRGNLLMALSNKFGWLVLTTGNKSELSVGYSTLYGDSAGGFAVIKDVPKTLVYRLVAERDDRSDGPLVPDTVVTRPPSAELRPDQQDEDSLPPYDILDRIIEGYVEHDLGRDQLIARGLPADEIDRIIRLIDLAEYKRRQNPPGIKITSKAFGRDRRMPITSSYRE